MDIGENDAAKPLETPLVTKSKVNELTKPIKRQMIVRPAKLKQ